MSISVAIGSNNRCPGDTGIKDGDGAIGVLGPSISRVWGRVLLRRDLREIPGRWYLLFLLRGSARAALLAF